MKTIAERIKEGLELRGMKQADLVDKTGIGKSSISTYISGEYEPKQKNIYKIAKALNVSESWLMGNDVPIERNPLNINLPALSSIERSLLQKYKTLDEKGKHTINTVLEMEYTRCTAQHLAAKAAHNDDNSEEQRQLTKQDIEEL